jgi:hypothetical protein
VRVVLRNEYPDPTELMAAPEPLFSQENTISFADEVVNGPPEMLVEPLEAVVQTSEKSAGDAVNPDNPNRIAPVPPPPGAVLVKVIELMPAVRFGL